uniref:UBC core domain-containing protein n=1 Tax=Attheya septentrionalis TaxID=420275 RepID=A0A7S2UDQ9_9STRA|mmetsp:Transcript_18959/g.34398  ORF Transcript_18959/g.34398 Transcript_18959/m.34398 type:complete len:393 (+) Transcript_18959:32-1210(+)
MVAGMMMRCGKNRPQKRHDFLWIFLLVLTTMTLSMLSVVDAAIFSPLAANRNHPLLPRGSHFVGGRLHDDVLTSMPADVIRREKQTDQPDSLLFLPILGMRGGGGAARTNTDEITRTVPQTVAHSILEITKRFHLPILTKFVKALIRIVERLLGVKLLLESPPKNKKERKLKLKRKQSRSSRTSASLNTNTSGSGSDDGDGGTTETITPASSSKRKQTKQVRSKTNHKNKNKKNQHNDIVWKEVKATSPNYRIQRELKAFMQAPPPNLMVKVGTNLRLWMVQMKGPEGTLYEGEVFRLRIRFPPNYPTEPPSVFFLPPHIPQHEHVYTNGDICLSLLGADWRPTMTAQSIAMSILSILSGATKKELPPDNARHAQNRPGQRQDEWIYHDDNC